MFLITAQFRRSRSRRDAEKEGVVYYKIVGQDDNGKRIYRSVNSEIRAIDESVLKSEKTVILSELRLLYCVIERRAESKETFSIDDVADDFRNALAGDESMSEVIAKSQTAFPLRSDIISVGREFKSDFQFFFPQKTDVSIGNIHDYIFNLSQSLKNEKRNSLANNYHSVLSNLKLFVKGKDIFFSQISQEFIHRYADWLKQTGLTDSTQSFYLRNLRMVLNKAHDDGLVGCTSGWFQGVNTSIERSTKVPDCKLNRALIMRIENLDLTGNKYVALVRDIFMFGFYCGGMELIDIANLEYSNFKNGMLVYRRRLKGVEKNVHLGEQAIKILERYKGMSDKYLFPLLTISTNASFISIRTYVCHLLKDIGKVIDYPKLSFNMNITAYNRMLADANIPEMLLKRE